MKRLDRLKEEAKDTAVVKRHQPRQTTLVATVVKVGMRVRLRALTVEVRYVVLLAKPASAKPTSQQ